MLIGIIAFLLLSIGIIFYLLYLKEYRDLMGNYSTLIKVLETRNAILLRILPEIKNKRDQKEVTKLIEEQISAKKNINHLIKVDVDLNKRLKTVYEEMSKSKNPIVMQEFQRIIRLEKNLKIIRREFNKTVDEYNQNLIDHKIICTKFFGMRPVNSYKLGNE